MGVILNSYLYIFNFLSLKLFLLFTFYFLLFTFYFLLFTFKYETNFFQRDRRRWPLHDFCILC